MFAIAVPNCTVLPTKLQPPPPPAGTAVAVAVGVGVAVGGPAVGVGDGVGVGGAKSSLIGSASSMPSLTKQALKFVQLSKFSASSKTPGEYETKPPTAE